MATTPARTTDLITRIGTRVRRSSADFACLCSSDGCTTLGNPTDRLSTVYHYHAPHTRATCGDRTHDRTPTKRMLYQLGYGGYCIPASTDPIK